ncbi:phenazine-specific anthranilate synthase component I [Actinoplanes sp. NBRC 14428]|uniref:anthranilate synthase n=1 Tax=Pseudosporangium ferrugineum TaxID=439699 RepID=A0A2T0RLA1_9ACTN|nr:anthranilate synthase family protein [Pseudosporangium ferrugineum]PRY21964.1 phenazine biosynthesis protein phzE [Pseudosporangium ferrugineum]BCJ50768.1 phenazine-specific anthranilate synthase component I [Actinoplanes sp. NBRC 14428]
MEPFALLHRDGAGHAEILRGDLVTVPGLADIPLPDGPGPRTLALIPYRQLSERGFACVDDGAPLECLRIGSVETVPLDELVASLPAAPLRLTGQGFDLGDEAYGDIVETVLRDEIGHGEGANFVIHRVFEATVGGDPVDAARAAFRNLLTGERGAYWTFLVHTGTRTLVGATPERHVSVADGITMMNPISGTFRHDGERDLAAFLADRKEIDELYMVLDEELKMMAAVAEHGGQVVGPYLKRMAHLTHTEYLLAGRGSLDVRDVLRATMFAPTVTGSPVENACRVIARHERRGRGYYAGVLALLGHDDEGRQTLDAPILIRTAEISPAGELRVPVGATLVRHSTAAGEVAETHTKAAGVLAALGATRSDTPTVRPEPDGPEILAALAARNDGLARFWLDQRRPGALTVPALDGRTAVVVDGEDTFTAMLAHQLRALGLAVTVVPWTVTAVPGSDLVIVGPGPGDPASADAKMVRLRGLVSGLLARRRPLLGVCLGHQILAATLGLPLRRREATYQGVARDIDLFGTPRRVGFYSSFTALAAPLPGVELAADPDGSVHALRGDGFAGVQFHPESVLSADGVDVLTELLPPLLSRVISPAVSG